MSLIAASNWLLFSVSKSSIYLIVLLNFLAANPRRRALAIRMRGTLYA